LDGLFAAQVVEHLTPESMMELIELCGRVLKPGGLVVLERSTPIVPPP
jgi:predicted SAM-dependent methyltransferase